MKKLITVMLVLGLTATAAATNIGKVLRLGIDGQVLDEVTLDVSDSFTMSLILPDGWTMDVMELRLVITSLGGAGHIELPDPPEDIFTCPPPFPYYRIQVVPYGLEIVGMLLTCTGVIVDHIQFHCDGAGDIQVQIIDIGTNNSIPGGDISQDMMGSILIHQVLQPMDRLVPDHYPTIQAAIDAAVDGDSVIVAEGVYTGSGNKNLDFHGKAITVRSTDPEDPCVVAATVIDCQNSGRGFYFHTGEDANSILSGFTITRGFAGEGGGIYCSGSSPTISNCVITGNSVYDWDAYGGGIYCGAGSSPGIINCTINNNEAQGPDAVMFPGSGGDAYGGAIYCGSNSHPTIDNCIISDNSAWGGNGYDLETSGGNAHGGGIYGDTRIKNCMISRNEAYGGFASNSANAGTACGGGVYGIVTMTNSTVSGNAACGGGDMDLFVGSPVDRGYGGGIFARGGSSIANCLVVANNARVEESAGGGGHGLGGGIYCDSSGQVSVRNCTIVANTASGDPMKLGQGYGGGVYSSSGTTISSGILWGNAADDGPQAYGGGSVTYSDVEGGYSGQGNINADPLFADANDYHLLVGSPCIDAGDPNYAGPPDETDLDGSPRVVMGRVDMGAYEFQGVVYVDGLAPGDPNGRAENGTQAHPFVTVQKAIDAVQDGHTIVVYPGQYLEPDPWNPEIISFSGKNIRLTSADPNDWDVVRNTVIRGIVEFDGTEDANCMLTGFTISDMFHGAIWGNHTHATISHCIMTGNAPCGAMVLQYCDGTISNCLITDNLTIYLCGVYPVVFGCHGLIKNCTIANNISGVGILGGTTTIVNSIICGNGDPPNGEDHQILISDGGLLKMSYCDVHGSIGFSGSGRFSLGPGNINMDPCFVRLGVWDGDQGDYHLKSEGWRWDPSLMSWGFDDVTSRCVDAANPGSPLANEPLRILPADPCNEHGLNVRVNMGAYGGTEEASMAPPGWALLADLSNNGIVNTTDLGWQLTDWLQDDSEQFGDLNRDGFMDMKDYAMLAGQWMLLTDWGRLPKVYISTPQEGSEISCLTDSVWIEAVAWDLDGSVVKVEFYLDGSWRGEDGDGSDGWQICTNFECNGTYNVILTAKATDDDGRTATSAPVTITVVDY
ncbi:MAG: right-handed parallel beta-helix repeat-containing protein [Planctomycetota bacterium]|jgi:hypothetical protein